MKGKHYLEEVCLEEGKTTLQVFSERISTGKAAVDEILAAPPHRREKKRGVVAKQDVSVSGKLILKPWNYRA